MSHFLKHKFEESKKSNPAFSLRAFALKAGISSGALTEVLRGQRNLSAKSMERISKKLNLNPAEKAQFNKERKSDTRTTSEAFRKPLKFINRAQFRYLIEGFHLALVALLDTIHFSSDKNWIAKRLGISENQAHLAIQRLIQAKVLRLENGKLKKDNLIFSTTDDVRDILIQASHLDTLKSAQRALHVNSVEVRDYTHMCVAVDPQKMDQFKQLIRNFQDQVEALALQSDHRTEVYKLAIQFFPMTELNESRGSKNEA